MTVVILLAMAIVLLGVVLIGIPANPPDSRTHRALCTTAIAIALFALLLQVIGKF